MSIARDLAISVYLPECVHLWVHVPREPRDHHSHGSLLILASVCMREQGMLGTGVVASWMNVEGDERDFHSLESVIVLMGFIEESADRYWGVYNIVYTIDLIESHLCRMSFFWQRSKEHERLLWQHARQTRCILGQIWLHCARGDFWPRLATFGFTNYGNGSHTAMYPLLDCQNLESRTRKTLRQLVLSGTGDDRNLPGRVLLGVDS